MELKLYTPVNPNDQASMLMSVVINYFIFKYRHIFEWFKKCTVLFICCTTCSHLLLLIVICCHSLSFVVTCCYSLYHSLSFVVTCCTTRCHSLSLVVIRCNTRLSFYKRSFWNVIIPFKIRTTGKPHTLLFLDLKFKFSNSMISPAWVGALQKLT